MSVLKDVLKNERVRNFTIAMVILVSATVFWLGLRIYLRTDLPFLVAPNTGEIMFVQGGLNLSEIVVEHGMGDRIVFRKPENSTRAEGYKLIVDRAVEKHQNDSNLFLKTSKDWYVFKENFIGKVVLEIPYLGYVLTREGILLIIILVAILILCRALRSRRARARS